MNINQYQSPSENMFIAKRSCYGRGGGIPMTTKAIVPQTIMYYYAVIILFNDV